MLTDGRYESYIRRVEVPYEGGTRRMVVDLVQVVKYPASVDAAIADGMPHDQAQVLDVWVRNQNPRLRTLPLASDLRIDLLPGDCIESRNHQLAKLVKDTRVMNGSRPAYYFTVTVAGGAVHHIVEHQTGQRLLSSRLDVLLLGRPQRRHAREAVGRVPSRCAARG